MSTNSNSYAEIINNTKVMLAGLAANAERVGKRGIDQDFITKLAGLYQEAQSIDNEQEALKARMKEKTDQLKKKMAEIEELFREAKKVVKLEMAQTSWKEFGIPDQR